MPSALDGLLKIAIDFVFRKLDLIEKNYVDRISPTIRTVLTFHLQRHATGEDHTYTTQNSRVTSLS
jgi:hypothetical protein